MKNHVSKYWLAVLCIGTTFLTGCVPEFKNPLPPPKNVTPDERILGAWHSAPGAKGERQLSIFPRKSGWIDVVWIYNINSDIKIDGIDMAVFEGYTTNVKQHKFACLRLRKRELGVSEAEYDKMGYLIFHYEITQEGTLLVSPLSKEPVEKLIKAGKLKGIDDFTVTSSSSELADVIARQGIKDFLDKDEDFNSSWTKLTATPHKPAGGESQ